MDFSRLQKTMKSLKGNLISVLPEVETGSHESTLLLGLLGRASKIGKRLHSGRDTDELKQVEKDLRSLAADARSFNLRRHPMVIEPLWGAAEVTPGPNTVIFAGTSNLRVMVSDLCRERDLELLSSAVTLGTAESRWRQLCRCSVGVFDLTAKGDDRASVCHSYGAALVLGIVPIVIIKKGAEMPFNLDVDPVEIDGEDDEATKSILGKRLDDAPYQMLKSIGPASVETTRSYVRERLSARGISNEYIDELDDLDPIKVEERLRQLIAQHSKGSWMLVHPVWSAGYPNIKNQRCFHVMPFHENFHSAREAVRQACGETIHYVRGDEAKDPLISRSIWQEICTATHLVVDISNDPKYSEPRPNDNVCVELGIIQASGRSALIVAQRPKQMENRQETLTVRFPEIAKVQVKEYADEFQLMGLANAYFRPTQRKKNIP